MIRHGVTLLCANVCGASCEGELTFREITMPTAHGPMPMQVRHVRALDQTWTESTFVPTRGARPMIHTLASVLPTVTDFEGLGPMQAVADATRLDQRGWICGACRGETRPAKA